MDGTLGSKTARMLDGSGVEITSRDEFEEIVRRAARAGFAVAVHAIGDQANRDALDGFEAAAEEWRPRGLRPRIEHTQLLAPEDVPRFAELGVAASVQFTHAPSDRDLADETWAGMTDRAYAWRSLLDAGTLVANGSDAPGRGARPARRASAPASCARSTSGRPGIPSRPSRSRRRSTRRRWRRPGSRTTSTGAASSFPGYLADLVVLDRDPVDRPARGAGRGEGRGDDARRTLGFRRSTVPLAPTEGSVYNSQQEPGALDEEGVPQPLPVLPGSSMVRHRIRGVQ